MNAEGQNQFLTASWTSFLLHLAPKCLLQTEIGDLSGYPGVAEGVALTGCRKRQRDYTRDIVHHTYKYTHNHAHIQARTTINALFNYLVCRTSLVEACCEKSETLDATLLDVLFARCPETGLGHFSFPLEQLSPSSLVRPALRSDGTFEQNK